MIQTNEIGFVEQKNAPKIGWDGIIGQIVNSATDAEQVHHILEDILGGSERSGTGNAANNLGGGKSHVSQTKYYRFNPIVGLPDEFPIDVTDPDKLNQLKQIAHDYLQEPAQKQKLTEIRTILQRNRGWRKILPWT